MQKKETGIDNKLLWRNRRT